MKYMSKTGIYKASNVIFNPTTIEAISYNWWSFVKKIKGKVVFNDYNYSNTTRRHQYKVKQLMHELGIKIDLIVKVDEGLQHMKSIKEVNERQRITLNHLACIEESKKLARNKKAKEKRAAAKLKNQYPELKLVVNN